MLYCLTELIFHIGLAKLKIKQKSVYIDEYELFSKCKIFEETTQKIPDTLFWKNHQKNALFWKIRDNFGAFFWKNASKITVKIVISDF